MGPQAAFGACFFTKLAQQRGEAQLVGPEGNYYLPKVCALGVWNWSILVHTGITPQTVNGDNED